ncbi:MAG: arginine deiminase family protein [Phycisphaerae bacterium]|nr:arginine deiminase family protein [Phycisphaerae bacterium]
MLQIRNETDCLKEIIVCSPYNFELIKPINRTQEYFFKQASPQYEILLAEHNSFVKTLENHGIKTYHQKSIKGCPYQLFTRDIGFVISETLCIASMASELRQPEVETLLELGLSNRWKMYRFTSNPIEGGDIILNEKSILVGIGSRTSKNAYKELVNLFSGQYEIVPMRLADDILHLDTVLGIPSEKTLLVYSPGLPDGIPKCLCDYEVISLDKEEAFTLASNVLPLSPNCVISQKRHIRVNDLLNQKGLNVITVEMDEITKLGGGPRCSVLPINRI